jgi:hypothetical protein
MIERRDPGKREQNDSPHETPTPSTPLPIPPENERVHDFEPDADTVRIECLTDQRATGPHLD